jgi:rubrerythrin
MSSKKPIPLFERQPPKRCPVCGETSYSPAGIHPQCSMRREDEKRMSRVKHIKRESDGSVATTHDMSAWQKVCPSCHAVQHAKKKECDCGHTFAVRARPLADEENDEENADE